LHHLATERNGTYPLLLLRVCNYKLCLCLILVPSISNYCLCHLLGLITLASKA
jgi:hypothetical protein